MAVSSQIVRLRGETGGRLLLPSAAVHLRVDAVLVRHADDWCCATAGEAGEGHIAPHGGAGRNDLEETGTADVGLLGDVLGRPQP